MDARTKALVALLWVLVAVSAGAGLVIFAPDQLLRTVGVVLVVVALVSSMPTMQFAMDAMGSEPEEVGPTEGEAAEALE